jgi:hypothetical protein
MIMNVDRIGAILLGVMLGAGTAHAQIPSAAERAERLPELVLGTETDDFAISQKKFELKAGQRYRLEITKAGFQEYMFRAPELFRFAWIYQITIEDIEVHTTSIYGIEFDDRGTAEITFTPIQAGEYEWFVEDFEDRMSGTFVVTP